MSESEERIDHYLKIVAINKIKAVVKAKFIKVFPEYDNEVEDYLKKAKERYIEEFIGVWV